MSDINTKMYKQAPYGNAGRLLVRGKIRLSKVENPKVEDYVTPNEDEYQKSSS